MDPLETGKLLIMLAGLAGLYLKLNSAVRAMSGKGDAREISNDPLKVQETVRTATLDDVKRVEKRVTKVEGEISAMKRHSDEWVSDIRDDMSELKDRMDDKFSDVGDKLQEISRAVGRLEGS
jgi:hypothetical protein